MLDKLVKIILNQLQCLVLIWLFSVNLSRSIDLKPIRVPSIVTEGSSIYLECKFDLEGFQLYAVKWRKNRGLFYKYQPDDPQGIKRTYYMPGVNVNLRYSNETHVFLENVDFNTQGTYSCDILSKDPFQKEVSSEDQLTVVHSDFLFTPLVATGPRSNQHVRLAKQSAVIVSPESEKERTRTTTLRKTSTLITSNNGEPLDYNQLENIRQRLSNSIDLSKIKNLNYNQNQNYYVNRNGLKIQYNQTDSQKVKTVETDYFPVDVNLKPHLDVNTFSKETVLNEPSKMTTIRKTVVLNDPNLSSPKNSNTEKEDTFVTNQKYKKVDHENLYHYPKLVNSKSANYEIEEDLVEKDEHFPYPHIHQHLQPKSIRKSDAGVYQLSPEQFHDVKFLLRNPNDVVLFKPVNSNGNNSSNSNSKSSIVFSLRNLILLFVICLSVRSNYI